MSGIVKLKIKKDENVSKYVQILRNFDDSLSTIEIMEKIENVDFVIEYEVLNSVSDSGRENKIESLVNELLSSGAAIQIYVDDRHIQLVEFRNWLNRLRASSNATPKYDTVYSKVEKNQNNSKINLKSIIGWILLIILIILWATSYLFANEGIVGLIFKAIIFLIITVFSVIFLKLIIDELKNNKKLNIKLPFKEMIKNCLAIICTIAFLGFGLFNEISIAQDLLSGPKKEVFSDYQVYKYTSTKGRVRHYLDCESDDGKTIRFNINLTTYNKLNGRYYGSKKSITVTYYENSKVIMEVN